MEERILRAVLHSDLSITWNDCEDRLNAHQAARQFIVVTLDGLSIMEENGETLRIAFDCNRDNEMLHVNPILMEHIDNTFRIRIPPLVRNNPGKWEFQLFICAGYNKETGELIDCYPSDKKEFTEYSSIPDDGITIPTNEDIATLYKEARKIENATGRLEEKTEAIVEVQKALEDKIKEFNGNLSGADARLQAEANGEVTVISTSILGAAIDEVELTFDGYVMGVTLIDWGDGTIDSNLKHTYKADGTYLVKLYGVTEILGNFLAAYRVPNGFNGGTTLLKLGNALQTIKASAFADYVASETEELYIPDSVTTIEQNAFVGCCTTIEKLIIGKGVTNIGAQALANCVIRILELKSTTPPTIGENAFMASGINKIIVPTEAYEAYKTAWSDYATLIDCLVYQSDLDTVNADLRSLIGGNTSLMLSNTERITAVEEKITENREEINKDIKNLYAITAQGGLYTMLEVEQAFSSRETADGENIVDGQYTAPTKIQGDTVACKNLFDISKVTNTSSLTNNGEALTVTAASPTSETLKELCPTLKAGDVLVMSFNTTSDVNFIMFTSLIRSWTNGQSITIDENMLNDTLTFYHNISSGKSAVISNIQIEYGSTALSYQPYFTGLKNAYFKGIKSTGKNLFNPERELSSFSATLNTSLRDFDETKVYVGMSNNNYVNLHVVTNVSYIDGIVSFTTTTNSGYGVGVPIKVKPDTQYSVSYRLITGSNVVLGIGFYNKNGALIEYSYSEKTFTTPIDCAWVLLVITNNLAGSISYTDIQLEESSAATAYEPYKEDTYEFPEAVELAFGDTLDVKNQKIINNGYTEVINIANKQCIKSSTTWQRDGFFAFYAINALSKNGELGAPHRITAICTNGFSQGSWQFDANTFENGTERYILTGNNNKTLYVIMPNSDLGVTQEDTDEVKIAAAKEWFANNSVIVRYKTVDTTETSIETPERYQAWKNGSETVVQGDTDNSEYGAIPTVTTEYFKLTEV